MRKQREESESSGKGSLKITDQNSKNFIFCGNWKCLQFDCLRHHSHEPFYVVIREQRWKPREDGVCEGKIT